MVVTVWSALVKPSERSSCASLPCQQQLIRVEVEHPYLRASSFSVDKPRNLAKTVTVA